MAGPIGETPDPLIEDLARDPYPLDFFAAVRLLQARCPQLPRVGYARSLARDLVRFAQRPALDFAPATVTEVERPGPGRAPVLYSRHFGLFGPNGPLPLALTEYAIERSLHYDDETFAAFCNIFHHRFLSFFFRAWADAKKTVDLDRPDDQHWAYYVGSLSGLGMESLSRRGSMPDRAKLYFTSRLAPQARNAEGLEATIQEFFGPTTEVQTFVGRWLSLPADSVCRLGESPSSGTLGSTAIAGARIWTSQLHFRVRLGPMKLVDFERLLPTGPSFRRLCDWIQLYTGQQYSWDAQIVLLKEEVPETRLGRNGRLGWTVWLKTKPMDHDPADLRLHPPGQT